MKKTVALTCAVLAVALAGAPARSGDKGDKALSPKDLVGIYEIVSGEHGGKPIPPKEIEADRVTFTEDAVALVDKDKKKVYAATYKLEGGPAGTRIHMTTIEPKKGETADGLIRKEADWVTLIYALPGGKAPTEFKSGEKQMMFTLKKVQKSS
jgi:uncharacterized protein (TIGR03067 family)